MRPLAPRPPIYRRQRSFATTAGVGVGVVALIAGVVALKGLIIMLLWGALAPQLGGSTIGYGTAVLLGMALGIISSYFRSSSK